MRHPENGGEDCPTPACFLSFSLNRGYDQVPWVVPEEFYSYIPAAEDVPLAADGYAPVGMPEVRMICC
jgi:hypothetical protein